MNPVTRATEVQQAWRKATDQTAQVLEVAYKTVGVLMANQNAQVSNVGDDFFPGYGDDVCNEGVILAQQAQEHGPAVFGDYIRRNLEEAMRSYFPNGVDSKQVMQMLRSDILGRVNVQHTDYGSERLVSVTLPPDMSFQEIFQAINAVSSRLQDGIYAGGRLWVGPKNDVPPGEYSFKIHFMNPKSVGATREEHVAFLDDQGEAFVNPFVLALAEAAQLAQHGIEKSLLQGHVVRTANVENAEGQLVGALFSSDHGVDISRFCDDGTRRSNCVAAGSAKQ